MEPTFKRKHAKEILKPCGLDNYYTIDKRGVWPKVKYDATMQAETELLRWRPARVFQGELGALDVDDAPMLPFPFTAFELAAFMLEGVGALVLGFYGDWSDGPNQKNLNEIDPDSKARTAIIQAYAAYREVEKIVGAPPLVRQGEADRLRKEYRQEKNKANVREGVSAAKPGTDDSNSRRVRADASTAELKSKLDAATTEAQAESAAWLKVMVNLLLQPAPVQDTATPAPVVAASDARPDPERRLALLRELGGTAKYARCEWKFTGIKALVESEKANGRKRNTEKTIRADLKEAAQNERNESCAGFSTGLGQR